ncbi:uncharacterized protein LOC123904748 isoform X2 [Trifolium pratense]|uniref:uncharacterized protein LOC123904748 isoform X2 n=1 Tax=Trifolium pratense TaxID=57577 RepID=UPI001E692CD0|nr:uncharacterized protein LOC123904748 isoform X2 [Trifolium pratense]
MHQCHSSLIPPRSFTNKKVTQLLKVFQFTDFQWHRLQMDSGNLVISVSDTSRERRCFSSPIESAEGFVDARGYVAALALGAQGVCVGSRHLNIYFYVIYESQGKSFIFLNEFLRIHIFMFFFRFIHGSLSVG